MENRFTYDALAGPQDILSFWCQELTPADWYATSDALDDTIRARFLATWQAAADRRGGDAQFDSWRSRPDHLLAYLVLVDQFPRNMFRGDARSFATDAVALAAAKAAIGRGWDIRIDGPARQFMYLPLMHSESLSDQERCVRLICARFDSSETLRHARAHRDIIRRFGRFPYRNAALGRVSSDAEKAFLAGTGYAGVLETLPAL